ncbi:hypothetical protein PV327_005248 [Microctonus hyperodae]|uniref:Uncharacterized protein n=1 Tax=Microctonus hyperodae TaxID=165561 RepID=A0AA39KZM1_MICHY|nr:hypothetical protein PV327_005248 [Microctonus hyperodae]
MAYCNKCSKSTNIMKGLKALQDTEALFKIASAHLEEGENSDALKTYLKILKILDETLALPIKDYHLCQQGIRLTILVLGNTVRAKMIGGVVNIKPLHGYEEDTVTIEFISEEATR